jgi:hypothetical protein
MERDELAWSGQSWRLPLWLGLSVAAMAAGTLHILLDASVGLFPARGTLAAAVAAALLLISLIHAWWAISLAAGARGVGGGVASAAILGLGWTLLTNGSAIVYCLPPCPEGAPLTDVAHISSLVLGIVAPAAAIWALWRRRAKGGIPMRSLSVVDWTLPAGALVLVVATIWALASAAVAP